MASLSACGNLGKRKKSKNLPGKKAKNRFYLKMMSFLRDRTMKATRFKTLSRKVLAQSRPASLAQAWELFLKTRFSGAAKTSRGPSCIKIRG
jgi:hypothetical protein